MVGKVRVDRYGRATGGKPLARGALYTMLQNRIYRGRIVHKDKHYPGAHEAIVDESLWDEVQRQLAANRIACASRHSCRGAEPSGGVDLRPQRPAHDAEPRQQRRGRATAITCRKPWSAEPGGPRRELAGSRQAMSSG